MTDKLANVEESLNLTKRLRTTVTRVFRDLASSSSASSSSVANEGETGSSKAATGESLKKNLAAVQKILSDLEKNSQAAAKADGPGIPLGNTAYLMLDDEEDKTFLYSQLVDGYKWTEKLTTQAGQAVSNLKRKHPRAVNLSDGAPGAKRNPKDLSSVQGDVQKFVQDIGTSYPEMKCQLSQACGSNVLEVTLPKTLKADVILHGTEVDQVIVRGLRENATTLSKKDTLNVRSKHAVFRTLTDYANAAVQHYYGVSGPEFQQLRTVLKWLHSFRGLFSLKCQKCQLHLKEDSVSVPLPPCWRDYSDLSAYHFQCKP